MSDERDRFAEEARALSRLGRRVHSPVERGSVAVVLDAESAAAAVRAWSWTATGDDEPETLEERVSRHLAGTLALIGLAIEVGGEHLADGTVRVELGNDVLATAEIAAELFVE